MAVMTLSRKSDGLVICASPHVKEWSDWYSLATVNQIPTISGVLYPQPWGVEQEAQDLELMFANHYPYTQASYRTLVAAWRKNQTLRFTDFYGAAFDVRVISDLGKDASSRWKDVRTKSIRVVEVTLMKLDYNA